ncbi:MULTISPECIES: TlpA family protein disulfide reductase [Olivibacter]|uniref:TlpA family protein disulfide reductase n=1 Tax=Olivibacter jilunii TaxID=985016 RepID=A0ABW6B7V8_9SPHI|nr:TlpA disulfide reductase family protein [Pseudosphingobacterium sp.]
MKLFTSYIRELFAQFKLSSNNSYSSRVGHLMAFVWRFLQTVEMTAIRKVAITRDSGLCVLKPYTVYLITLKILFCVCLAHARQSSSPEAAHGVALSTDSIKPLQIGDTIPEALWHMPLQMVKAGQEGSTTVTLNDYRGKLIILDFWATWCGSCIAAMPKLDSLNRRFNSNVKILPITYESQQLVRRFIKSNKYLKELKLLSIVDQPIVFNQFFPHKMLPHIIWIGRQGEVMALSTSGEVTEHNVKEAIIGNELNIDPKKDMDIDRPLFLLPDFPEKLSLEKYAIVVKGKVEGLPVGARSRIADGKQYGQAFFNNSLLRIYMVLGRHLIDDFNDKSFLFNIAGDDSLLLNETAAEKYSIDFQLRKSNVEKLYPSILEELNNATPYHASVEAVKTECLVLRSKKSSTGRLKTKGGDLLKAYDGENNSIRLRNAPFVLLVKWLNNSKNLPPIINESGVDYKIDINLAFDPEDLGELRSKLIGYGLELTKEERYLKKLVINKNKLL